VNRAGLKTPLYFFIAFIGIYFNKNIMKEELKKSLKELYKKNPFAEKLSDKDAYYRAVNQEAFDDYLKDKVVRGNPEGISVGPQVFKNIDLKRKTPFPAFQKGKVLEEYLPKEGSGYIFESKRPMVARGEINPVTKTTQPGGGHFAHRPFDPFTGKTVPEISSAEVRAFESKPNPIMGYREVGKGYPVVQAAKQSLARTARGVAKGVGSAALAGAASAAVEPIAEAAMQKYEEIMGYETPDPKSTAGRLRALTIGGGPLAAPYEVGKAATELVTDIIPSATQLAYEKFIESPAREKRIKERTQQKKSDKRKS
jgi:hypothetical protein